MIESKGLPHRTTRFFPPSPLEYQLVLYQGIARLDHKGARYGSLGFRKTDSGLRR
jgi:hypothetical protein